MLLEISQYLENYLWPNFDEETATYQHVMSIILMVNEKFRENVPAWDGFSQREDALPGFFNRVVTLKAGRQLRQHEKVAYLMFAINAFQSLENSAVRARVLKLASLPLWHALSKGRLQVCVTHSALLPQYCQIAVATVSVNLRLCAIAFSQLCPPAWQLHSGYLKLECARLGTLGPGRALHNAHYITCRCQHGHSRKV